MLRNEMGWGHWRQRFIDLFLNWIWVYTHCSNRSINLCIQRSTSIRMLVFYGYLLAGSLIIMFLAESWFLLYLCCPVKRKFKKKLAVFCVVISFQFNLLINCVSLSFTWLSGHWYLSLKLMKGNRNRINLLGVFWSGWILCYVIIGIRLSHSY